MKTYIGLTITMLALMAGEARAQDQEVCLRYPVETIDSGLGIDFEDHYALNDEVWPYWKSRGAAYQVLDPDTQAVIQQGYASDDNGCFVLPEDDIPAGGQVVIFFYLDSLLLDNIRVRTRSGSPANCNDDPFANHLGEPEYCQPIACMGMSGVLAGPGKKYFDYPCSQAEVTLQALAAYPLYWWHHFDPAALDYDFTVTVRHQNGCAWNEAPCSTAGWNGATGGAEIVVNIDDETEDKFRQKFLVGHEVGHALEESHQFATFGTTQYLYGDYDPPAGGAACDSAGEQHALTSLEYTSAAVMEGFAHFLSADAYNDHNDSTGRFTYYKDALGFPRDIALEGEPAFNAAEPWKSNRFAQRVCDLTDPTDENRGTELDWLRFFWDLHTEGGGADGEHQSLFQLRVDAAFQGTAWNDQNGYDLLQQNVCEGAPAVQAFQDDFLAFAGSDDDLGGNGVKPTAGEPSCP